MIVGIHRILPGVCFEVKVSKGAQIRNRYNQVPQLTQDINGKVTNSQFDTTNESQEVKPFPAGDHKAHINRHAQRHSKHKTEKTLKIHKVSKGAKIRNRYNQVPHLTQDTNGKVTDSQTNAKRSALSQQVTTKHIINRRAQRHSKHKTQAS